MKHKVTCNQCKKVFHKEHSQITKTTNNFCGRECYYAWQRDHPPKAFAVYRNTPRGGHSASFICDNCGTTLWRAPSNFRYKHHFCNRDCRAEWQRTHLQGEENPAWKGGRWQTAQGYILVYAPEHHRANNRYVHEHILAAEEKYGRPIPNTKHVHHLNGVKNDNRPENLVVLDPADHDTFSVRHALQERIRELEEKLSHGI